MDEIRKVIGRLAGVDYGAKRIGLAITDVEQRIAVPSTTLDGTGDMKQDATKVERWVVENAVIAVVVGMPFNMDGSMGQQAVITQRFVQAIKDRLGRIPVEIWDERLSSYQADEWLQDAGVKTKSKKRNPLRDALAATAILRSYLAAKIEKEPGNDGQGKE